MKANRAVRFLAWMAVLWGVTGGWQIVGERWPQLNTVTKDQITIITALVILSGRRGTGASKGKDAEP